MGKLGGILHAVIFLLLCTGCVDVARGQTTDPTEGNLLLHLLSSVRALNQVVGDWSCQKEM
jgi:hypothetical protein